MTGRRYKKPALQVDDPQRAWEQDTAVEQALEGLPRPPEPEKPCNRCGQGKFWLRPEHTEWVCWWCHPPALLYLQLGALDNRAVLPPDDFPLEVVDIGKQLTFSRPRWW